MNLHELRLGNIVTDKFKFTQIVEMIGKKEIRTWFPKLMNFGVTTEDDLIGVELNDDWLTKLGLNLRIIDKGDGIKQRFWHTPHFGRHNEHYLELQISNENSLKSDFLWLNWNIGGGNDFVYLPRKLKYVHELQNLFYALSGVELICA